MLTPRLWLTAAAALGHALTVSAQTPSGEEYSTEPVDFDVAEALAAHGVAVSNFDGLSDTARGSKATRCSFACETLKFTYGDEAVETDDETAYTDFVGSYWSAHQTEATPHCIFKPSKPEHVSVAVLLSRLTQCPFAAKSGGHAAMTGASGADGGITISFTNLKAISLSEDKKLASVQPGNVWGDVFEELKKSDVTVIGGRLFNIGVGGLTTGGGISYFSNKYGWACDNVESYEVVTATGIIVKASATRNQDLFWALRGGGNNFGLVVSFNLKTVPLPGGNMWGGTRTYMGDDAMSRAGEAFHNLIVNAEDDTKAGLWHVWVYYNHTSFAIPTLYYAEPDGDKADIFEEFNAIPAAVDEARNRDIAEFAAEGMSTNPSGLREMYYAVTSKADLGFLNWLKDLYYKDIMTVTDIPGIVPAFIMQGITVPQLRHMKSNGGNALGLDVEDGPLYINHLAIMWPNKEDDDAIYRFASNFFEKASAEAKKRGVYNDYVYMNYASQYQDVIGSYGKENKDRLKRVAAKYDPREVFQKLQPGYFKLDRAPVPDSGYFSF